MLHLVNNKAYKHALKDIRVVLVEKIAMSGVGVRGSKLYF